MRSLETSERSSSLREARTNAAFSKIDIFCNAAFYGRLKAPLKQRGAFNFEFSSKTRGYTCALLRTNCPAPKSEDLLAGQFYGRLKAPLK